MKAKMLMVLSLLAILLLLSAFAWRDGEEEEAAPTPTAGYSVYTDEANGLSIFYPEDWGTVPEELLYWWTLVAFWAPSPCADFISYFSVNRLEMPSPMSIQEYWAIQQEHLLTNEGYIPISEEELTLGGWAAIKHVFTAVAEEGTLEAMHLYLVEDTRAWIIACFSAPACWNQYEPIFDTAVSSFRLLE